MIAVDGKFRPRAEFFSNPRLHRESQIADLRARVVVVELPRYAPALRFEQSADRVAEGRLPAVPDVERAGGIGRDELDDYRASARAVRATVALARSQYDLRRVLLCCRVNPEIYEAGAREFNGHPIRRRNGFD